MLKDLNGVLGEFLNKNKDEMSKTIEERFEEANKDEFSIKAKKEKDGDVKVELKGERLSILLGLAGLEHTILEKLEVPKDIWEIIKKTVYTEDAE